MHLINTSTYEMREFEGRDIPEYAILSHTWGEGEVTFTDYESINHARTRPAFHKIEHSCRLATEYRLNWVWIDTCCIDKRSSAELSEAINSMFVWYRNSSVCFAYLSDVPAHVTAENDSDQAFERSRWFTRGWTLQELLAPENVVFHGNGWIEYGTRQQLKGRISAITNINEVALEGRTNFKLYSVASRMSWAAQRQTNRVEDMAYCLLGIFEVHMPLLYGEGERAFIRLQEEILRETDDQSIFAWEREESGGNTFLSGLLAASPAYFTESKHFMRGWRVRNDIPPTVTSRGVRIKGPLVMRGKAVTGFSYLVLDCQDGRSTELNEEYMAIELYNARPVPFHYRSQPWKLLRVTLTEEERVGLKEVYVQKTTDPNIDPFTLFFPEFP